MFSKLVWRSVVGHRTRWLLTLASIVVPAGLVTGAANFMFDTQSKMTREVRTLGANLVITCGTALDADRVQAVLNSLPSEAESVLTGEEWDSINAARITWVNDLKRLIQFHPEWTFQGKTWDVVVGRRLAERTRLKIGDQVDFFPQFRSHRVSGIISTDGPLDRVFLREGDPNTVGRIEAHVDPRRVEDVASRIESKVRGTVARPVRVIAATEAHFFSQFSRLLGLIAILVLLVSGLGMAMTLTAAVGEKRREIGLFKALGASPATVLKVLAVQILLVLVGGVILGTLAGIGLSDFLGRRVFGGGTALHVGALLISAAACLLMAALAAVVPARRALSVDPAIVLKEE